MTSGKPVIHKFWRILYLLLISISLILHVFNDLNITEELKYFHVFAAGACLIVLVFFPHFTKIQLITYSLCLVSLISASYSPYPGSMTRAISMTIVVIGCSGLRFINGKRVVDLINWFIPIVLVCLYLNLQESLPVWRYTAYYNDPNYLCTTLMVFEFLILEKMLTTRRIIVKILLVCEIVVIYTITIATLSRTGICCMLLLLIAYFWELIVKYKYIAFCILLCCGIYFISNTPQFIIDASEKFETREENAGAISSAADLRLELALKGTKYVFEHPQFLPFGLGLGATGHLNYFEGYVGETDLIDHNTLTSTFSEMGIVGFLLFISLIIFSISKNITSIRQKQRDCYLRLIALISLLIFCLSINQLTYLPFWWLVYLLNNDNITNADNSCN